MNQEVRALEFADSCILFFKTGITHSWPRIPGPFSCFVRFRTSTEPASCLEPRPSKLKIHPLNALYNPLPNIHALHLLNPLHNPLPNFSSTATRKIPRFSKRI